MRTAPTPLRCRCITARRRRSRSRARRAPRPGPSGIPGVRSMIRSRMGSGHEAARAAPASRVGRSPARSMRCDQLVVRHAGRLGGHRHQARRRHAGDRVHFQTVRLASSRRDGNRRALTPRQPSTLTARARQLARDLARHCLPGRSAGQKYSLAPGGVLGLVVVEPALRADLDDRQRLIAEHRDASARGRRCTPRSAISCRSARRSAIAGRRRSGRAPTDEPDVEPSSFGFTTSGSPQTRWICASTSRTAAHRPPATAAASGGVWIRPLHEHALRHRLVHGERAGHARRSRCRRARRDRADACSVPFSPAAAVERDQNTTSALRERLGRASVASGRPARALRQRERGASSVARRQQAAVGRVDRDHLVAEPLRSACAMPRPVRSEISRSRWSCRPASTATFSRLRLPLPGRRRRQADAALVAELWLDTSGSPDHEVRPVSATRTGWNRSRPFRPELLAHLVEPRV